MKIRPACWNEGFRYRDIETGVWLSRDPAGFVDGPNLYAYVKQNPWSKFDPHGLWWREALSTGLDFIPGVSTVKSAVELVAGKDLITGESISRAEAAASLGASFIPGGKGALKTAKIAAKLADKAFEINGKADAVMAIADDIANDNLSLDTLKQGSSLRGGGKKGTNLKSPGRKGQRHVAVGSDSFAKNDAANSGARWNNGWRTADGKFASPNGAGRSGAAAEQSVWDAVAQKPGWSVIEGQVGVRNASGQLRYYDGAAVSPRGRVIGLEVKSGSATKTPAQRAFDSGVNTQNPAIGVGQNQGLEIGRLLEIRR